MDKMKKASIVAALCALLLFVGAVGCNGNEPADIGEVSGVSDASRTADSEGSTTQETEDDQAESSSANMPGESNNDEHSNQTPHKTTSKTTASKTDSTLPSNKDAVFGSSKSLPAKIEGDTIRVLAFEGWTREHGNIIKELEKRYGATVEYTVTIWSQVANKLALDTASGISYDMTATDDTMVSKGLMQKVDKYFDLSEDVFSASRSVMQQAKDRGRFYMVNSTNYPFVILYNEDIFNNLGITSPGEYYEEGRWSFDTLKTVLSELANKTTSDGEKITPFTSWDLTSFLSCNNTDFVKFNSSTNRYELNLGDTKVREVLQFFQDINYNIKGFSSYQGWSEADFKLGNTAMYMDRFGNKTHFMSTVKNFDWDFVPMPTGPSGNTNVTPGSAGWFGIPASSKNPSGGAAYIYLFLQQDYQLRQEYLRNYLKADQIKRYESLYNKVISSDVWSVGISTSDNLFWEVASGKDITSVLESYKTKWNSDIKTFYNSAVVK